MKALATLLIAITATLLMTWAGESSVNGSAIEPNGTPGSPMSSACGEGSTVAGNAARAATERPNPVTVIGYLNLKMVKSGGEVNCTFTTTGAPDCRESIGSGAADTQVVGD